MNAKVSEYHGCTPYSLLFARPLNGLQNYETSESRLHSAEEMQKRLDYMTKVVYPAVNKRVKRRIDQASQRPSNQPRIQLFTPGAYVMALDELRTTKGQPRYTGPFTVIRRTRGGSYILKGPDGTEYRRPPSVLKLCHQTALNPGSAAVVREVINHHLDNQCNINWYHVLWADPNMDDTWLPESSFDDIAPIQAY